MVSNYKNAVRLEKFGYFFLIRPHGGSVGVFVLDFLFCLYLFLVLQNLQATMLNVFSLNVCLRNTNHNIEYRVFRK